MAVSQDNVRQQQSGSTESEHAPVHGSDAQPSQGASAGARTPARRNPTRKPVAQSPQGAAGGEAQSADVDLSQALEQQIAQAIQPMLDEFRQQMAQLSDQMAAMPIRGAGKSDTGQEASQGADTQAPPVPTQQPSTRQAPVQSAAPETAPAAAEQPQPQQALTQVQHVRERLLSGALTSAVQTVERYSAQWLQSLLAAGLGALLAESTRATVQQRAEQGLHALLQKAFEAAPADFANQEMLEKTERTLQLILRDALDAVYAEGVRESVQQGVQQTIQQALRGDFGSALIKVEEMLQVMMAALIGALRRHQQTIFRLLLALLLLAVGSSLEQSGKAK